MNCNSVQSKIPDYLEKNLFETEMTDIAGHLKTCKVCNHVFTEFNVLWKKTKNPELVQPSKGFSDRVIKKLYAEDNVSGKMSPGNTGSRWFYPLATAATIIAGMFIGYQLGNFPSPAGMLDARSIAIQSFVEAHYLTDVSLIPQTSPGDYSLNNMTD